MHTSDGTYVNGSTITGDLNTGNRGKFTETQLQERVKVHARSVATKFPSIPDICKLWKEQFDISISADAEKSWRRNNWDMIQKKKTEMIDSGDIEIAVVGPKALADNLLVLAMETAGTMKKMRAHLTDKMADLWSNRESRAETDPKIREASLKEFVALSHSLTSLSTSMTRQIQTLADISGSARAKMKSDEQEEEKATYKNNSKDFDPSEVVVTDADRILE